MPIRNDDHLVKARCRLFLTAAGRNGGGYHTRALTGRMETPVAPRTSERKELIGRESPGAILLSEAGQKVVDAMSVPLASRATASISTWALHFRHQIGRRG